ncbi:potassium transporter [bacterium CG_4_9_14_3_um_filter_65_15]|nr:MAG: potassium transporter [bacterium CG_4_9_14_3_um_filter_65_15]
MRRLQRLSAAQALVLYYGVAIFVGAGLLTLPVAGHGGGLSFLDALFTATSAQCVTGLVVVDTGTRLTVFGQLVVLTLIQIGGLGIMTFSVYLFFHLGVGVGAKGRWIINETLSHTPVKSLPDLIRRIFLLTAAAELVGAVLLAVAFVPRLGVVKGLYFALFHSISAFCNAGFGLYSDSFVGFQGNWLVNLTIMGLITAGGLGFLVIMEVLIRWRHRRDPRPRRLSLHANIVLTTSAILLVAGTLAIWLLERGGSLAEMSGGRALLVSLFQSVTTRTAGFNTMDLDLLRTPTIMAMVFLMFIGASPGSTGGGVKTTSLALFYGIMVSRLKGNRHTNLFRRTLPDETVTKALALVMLAVILIGIALFGLLLVQVPERAHEGSRVLLGHAFEAVSAFATVGLSLGVTGALTVAGKWIIIVLMFIGRVGLLTVAFAIAGRTRRYPTHYAEESIMIG